MAHAEGSVAGRCDSLFTAYRAGPPMGVKLLLKAALAEHVPADGATRFLQDFRADRAEEVRIRLRLKHQSFRAWMQSTALAVHQLAGLADLLQFGAFVDVDT